MCGILGVTNFDDKSVIKSMLDTLKKRGPDDSSIYINNKLSLGHTRLSIIDIKKGQQPIYNENRSVMVIFNGEIYNYKKLRKDLIKKRHKFRTNSDTEVLVHLWEEYQQDMVKYLDGMFAFCIYDLHNEVIYLARDHAGIKPLFYSELDNNFVFGSEIKTILKSNLISSKVDDMALIQYLRLGHCLDGNTMITNIVSLQPGNSLLYNLNTKKTIIRDHNDFKKLYNFDAQNVARYNLDYILNDSVELNMESDVPVGSFLSGGLDSSLVTAMMKQHVDKINTFSIGLDGNDESEHAETVADHVGTNHHSYHVTKEEIIKNIEPVLKYNCDCIGDLATVPTYILSKNASKRVKVVLTGEGADENFGGYKRYNQPFFFPVSLKKKLYLRYLTLFGETHLQRYVGDRYRFCHDKSLNIGADNCLDTTQFNIQSITHFERYGYLSNNLLIKTDRMSSAHGLEARVPYLNKSVVNFSYDLHARLKNNKNLLKSVARKYLPDTIINRQKHGFSVPLNQYILDGFDIVSKIDKSVLNKLNIDNKIVIDHQPINNKFRRSADHHRLWRLFVLTNWYNNYVVE